MLKAAVIAAAFSLNVDAADQTDMEFDQGTVLIRCTTPDGHPQISRELFKRGFPHWITNLQKRANEGLIARVHYLGSLKEGLFIVVNGENRQEALKNAVVIIDEINTVMENAIEDSGDQPGFDQNDACQHIEIGPVAILPK